MRMGNEMAGEWEQNREAVEALETMELRDLSAMAREHANDGVDGQDQGQQCDEEEDEKATALAVLLGDMVAYLSSKVDVNDLDIVSFSLHHLFCGFDSLYRVMLPSFVVSLTPESGRETDVEFEQLRPRTWIQLQALRQVLRRMEPLCQLLSEAGECILGQLGYSGGSEGGKTDETEGTHGEYTDGMLARIAAHEAVEQAELDSEQNLLYVVSSEGIEQALRDLVAILACWQQRYRDLPSFRSLLYTLFPTVPLLLQPDAPFTQLLECASTLFGDILPAFQALSPGDDEAVIMLLFDLLQQIDLVAVECKTLLELLHMLLERYAVAMI
jgi:hypothetical protein